MIWSSRAEPVWPRFSRRVLKSLVLSVAEELVSGSTNCSCWQTTMLCRVRLRKAQPTASGSRAFTLELTALEGRQIFVSDGTKRTAYPVRQVILTEGKTRIVTQDARGGFPFAAAKTWEVLHTGYAERLQDGTWHILPLHPFA